MRYNKYTIGLDLGARRHHVCVLNAAGNVVIEEVIANTQECLLALSARYPRATFIMETGTHSPWVSRLLEAQRHPVLVANARKLRAISESHTKNDAEDARMLFVRRPRGGHPPSSPSSRNGLGPRCRVTISALPRSVARLGRADPKLLSPIKHRSEAGQRALLRLKVREALVRGRVNQMNSVRFLLKSLGLAVASGAKAMTFTRRLRPMLDDATRALVEPLLATIDDLNAKIAAMDRELEAFGLERYPVTERLRQVAGVGPLTALAFVVTIEDPARFPQTRDVGAYLGLVPKRDQSGESDKQLPITKAGHRQLRCLLVNCAHYILGPFGPPSRLREAGERIAARGGKSAKKRAVIAVARKLFGLLPAPRAPAHLTLRLAPGHTCGVTISARPRSVAVTLLALWKSGADYLALPHSATDPTAAAA